MDDAPTSNEELLRWGLGMHRNVGSGAVYQHTSRANLIRRVRFEIDAGSTPGVFRKYASARLDTLREPVHALLSFVIHVAPSAQADTPDLTTR
jgi:hypothetical protein